MILVVMARALAAILDHDRRMETNTKVGGAEKKEPGSLMVELSSHHGLFMFGLVLQERN